MDLALLVYGISLLEKFQFFFGMGLFILFVVGFASLLLTTDGTVKPDTARKVLKRCAITAVCFAFILTILPNEKTAYTMVGAYAAQKIAQDVRTQEVGSKVLTIINQKLDGYITDGAKGLEEKLGNATKALNSKVEAADSAAKDAIKKGVQ